MKHFLSLITLTTVYFFCAGAWAVKPAPPVQSTKALVTAMPLSSPLVDNEGNPLLRGVDEKALAAEDCRKTAAAKANSPGFDTEKFIQKCRIDRGVMPDPCKELKTKMSEKYDELVKICGKASTGKAIDGTSIMGKTISECKKNAEECDSMTEDNENGLEQLTSGAGVTSYSKKCPSSTDQPKTLKTDLKDKQKDLNELKKDMLKDEKDASDSFEKLQKEISELQENFDSKNLEMDANLKKQKMDSAQALQDLTAAIEANNAQILEAEATLSSIEGKKTENLANLSDAIMQTDCEAAVLKLAESLKTSSSGSNGGMIKQGAKKLQNLKLRYAQCIEAKNQARTTIITGYQKEKEKIDYSITRLRADKARKEQKFAQMQSDAEAAVTAAGKAKDVAKSKFDADKQRLTNKLQNLMTTTQKQGANNRTRLMELTTETKQLGNELAMIGGGSITVNATFAEAIGARKVYDNARATYLNCKDPDKNPDRSEDPESTK